MILYHGSNINIDEIDLNKCKPFKDFGKGFYLTEIYEQAERMAINTAAIYNGTPVVNSFEFDEEIFEKGILNVKIFYPKPTIEWARFIVNNRNRDFKDYDSLECNIDGKYDIVVGPVANDRIAATIRRYMSYELDEEGLKRQLTYTELTNQYSFNTEKAISYLKKVK